MTHLLLVEDNPDNAELICALLEDEYDIHVAGTADDAMAYLEEVADNPPPLFLLDISLPGRDGVELLRQLRGDDRFSGIPAIALTAHAMKDDRNRLLAVGFDDYVSKPVDEAILTDSISRLLSP